MNLFVLDNDPVTAARAHVDKHVVKMPLEAAQIACTVAHGLGVPGVPFRPTHKSHPCVAWAGASSANFLWVLTYLKAVAAEYGYRYDRVHACMVIARWMEWREVSNRIETSEPTPHPQVMPEQYRGPDVVDAYRAYYMGEKGDLACWRRRGPPGWWLVGGER